MKRSCFALSILMASLSGSLLWVDAARSSNSAAPGQAVAARDAAPCPPRVDGACEAAEPKDAYHGCEDICGFGSPSYGACHYDACHLPDESLAYPADLPETMTEEASAEVVSETAEALEDAVVEEIFEVCDEAPAAAEVVSETQEADATTSDPRFLSQHDATYDAQVYGEVEAAPVQLVEETETLTSDATQQDEPAADETLSAEVAEDAYTYETYDYEAYSEEYAAEAETLEAETAEESAEEAPVAEEPVAEDFSNPDAASDVYEYEYEYSYDYGYEYDYGYSDDATTESDVDSAAPEVAQDVATEDVATEEVASEEVASEEVASEEVASEEVASEEVAVEDEANVSVAETEAASNLEESYDDEYEYGYDYGYEFDYGYSDHATTESGVDSAAPEVAQDVATEEVATEEVAVEDEANVSVAETEAASNLEESYDEECEYHYSYEGGVITAEPQDAVANESEIADESATTFEPEAAVAEEANAADLEAAIETEAATDAEVDAIDESYEYDYEYPYESDYHYEPIPTESDSNSYEYDYNYDYDYDYDGYEVPAQDESAPAVEEQNFVESDECVAPPPAEVADQVKVGAVAAYLSDFVRNSVAQCEPLSATLQAGVKIMAWSTGFDAALAIEAATAEIADLPPGEGASLLVR